MNETVDHEKAFENLTAAEMVLLRDDPNPAAEYFAAEVSALRSLVMALDKD